ncbi:2-phospho-L-lactate guanylyltransferase [Mycobacterium sp. MS1601]|uniref:2-phospho-L-lactate guanylyltransferase n=1 Tax=Mycobacterium sp. MS1601 TaxID=1936029 RepID=UPI0009794211|nr:2-phospho-L-lactate guanylyltransferase [Mycobacterium sp. MS1601]AQA04627.1 2-phospho-L-lactate guanylyltransferase [Mycobacterium sp. MS1601]
MPTTHNEPTPVVLLIPAKPLHQAKTRLRTSLHLPVEVESLVAAMFNDTLTAALQCPTVENVVVLTTDPRLHENARDSGAQVWGKENPQAGLNATLRRASSELHRRGSRIAVIPADLPALRSNDLEAALVAAGSHRSFCADRRQEGTTLLVTGGRQLHPEFGRGSALAHALSGARGLAVAGESLRTDVDTAEDLLAAGVLGLGEHTAALLRSRLALASFDPSAAPWLAP